MSRNREFCERFSVNLTKLDAYQLKKKNPPEKVNFENIISIPIIKKNNKKDNIEGKESNFFKQAKNWRKLDDISNLKHIKNQSE